MRNYYCAETTLDFTYTDKNNKAFTVRVWFNYYNSSPHSEHLLEECLCTIQYIDDTCITKERIVEALSYLNGVNAIQVKTVALPYNNAPYEEGMMVYLVPFDEN